MPVEERRGREFAVAAVVAAADESSSWAGSSRESVSGGRQHGHVPGLNGRLSG
jgi:hypothetical protein